MTDQTIFARLVTYETIDGVERELSVTERDGARTIVMRAIKRDERELRAAFPDMRSELTITARDD